VPEVDYLIDLNTGVMTPLPEAIIRSVAKSGELPAHWPLYAASPDGSRLAYVGSGEEGRLQIFIAGIDGSGVRQVTHAPTGARSPAWSPDGTLIAYHGESDGGVRHLFVLDVATGESRQITDEGVQEWAAPQFTPDGSSLLYTAGSGTSPVLRTVPVAGGKSMLFIGPGGGLGDALNGSLSPDGSLVTYLASGEPLSPDGSPMTYQGREIGHVGPGRFVANVDGTERRFLPGWVSNPAGTWSPDGSRIVCLAPTLDEVSIIVVDIATGGSSPVAKGNGAIWLDRHTLLVDVV
jgi:Tol biopolymer transport system component